MQDAFGVERGDIAKYSYTKKQTKERRANTVAGGLVGGAYLGFPAAVGVNVAGQAAGIKATKMHRAANNPTSADSKYAGNPHYAKYVKATNLADRPSTPEEGAAARGMADRISAKHGPFTAPKAKKLGAGYKTLRRVQRLGNGKKAVGLGFGLATAAGAGVANGMSRHGAKKQRRR